MLTGRESLIRLIGKRRRTLSSSSSLLSKHTQSCSSTPPKAVNGESSSSSTLHKEEELSDQGVGTSDSNLYSNLDWVTCPVCGNNVRAMDYIVNSHLDACLTRGTKRKLTQRTLLHFSFGSRLDDKTFLIKADNLEDDENQMKSDDNFEPTTVLSSPKTDSAENNGRNECASETIYSPQNILQTCVEVSLEHLNRDDLMNSKEVDTSGSCSSSPDLKMTKLASSSAGVDTTVGTLETYIVGRKFADEVELNQGTLISLLRDPKNVKDPNAIKVVHTDSGCELILGYLPRELAKHLSPLIDKCCLKFECSITSLPRHPLDVVPIKLVCNEIALWSERGSDCELFKSLWESAVCVVENAKSFSPSMTKYQKNFHLLIQEVLKQHSHLFTNDEKLFLESFSSLPDDCQRLFVRLYTRKGPWFRTSSISYPEISDFQQAIEELCMAGYIVSLQSAKHLSKNDIKEALDLLTVSELREILTLVHLRKGVHSLRKRELNRWLFSAYEDGTCPLLVHMLMERTGPCVRISSTAEFLFWRAQRLLFLNGEQDLSSFLLADLGLVKYPSYTRNISHHIFPTRSDLLAYEEAIEVAQVMDQSLDENNIDTVISCIEVSHGHISTPRNTMTHSLISESEGTFLSHFSASWVYSKVATLGVSFFERERRYDNAIMLLKDLLSGFTCDGRRGYWTLRLSVDLEHKGHIDESLLVAETGVLDPWVRAGSKMALQRRIVRLGKPPRRWKTPSFSDSINRKINEVHIRGRPLNCEVGMKNRYYGDDGEQCGVEQLALQYYAGEGGGWQGVHAESGIWMTIFGLLMWDIIFADIPDVFRTSFQTTPLDLDTDRFYMARKSIIESRLCEICSGLAQEILMASWESHLGTACRCVNWERHSLPDLLAVVSCIGGPCLASLCRYVAQDYRSWSSGMPDLLLWRLSTDYGGGEAKLVEVKGLRDRLSEQQRAWLLLLMDCGFNVEVCKVIPVPSYD
eukprot:TRINITY_DN7387_c0_g1_i9.p1 TRINITY_DN7387_c0_g1~~TRINITY_DN7387_c0_g1_i9.p1  ORF type:complete len:975 (-),score=160.16 TRINITY_DN7387_c0_g1_i9:347-3271(-)